MRPKRGGFTLIEMLAVMVGVTIVIGLCVTTLQGLLLTERSNRRENVELASLAELAATFRADASEAPDHEASPRPFGAGLEVLTLTRPGRGSVSYRATPGVLVRTVHDSEAEAPRVETFRLRPSVTPRLELLRFEGATLVRLVPLPTTDGNDADLRIEAVVGSQADRSRTLEVTP